ncbi:MAG: hypothetical protein Q8P18_06235 [Pseudomonadota bacterium]|nr:hypothetical protein [Pseudomonadota bacterium]
MPAAFPDFLTHYSRGEPFRSVTSAPQEQWGAIVAGFSDANVWGRDRFADPQYLSRRLVVEERLRAEFVDGGGEPQVEHPFYCVVGGLGRWERQRTTGMRAYILPLTDLPSASISFTFGDSLLTYDEDNRSQAAALGRYLHPLSGRLYRLEGVRELASRIPAGGSDPPRDLHKHLEAQVWVTPNVASLRVIELPVC